MDQINPQHIIEKPKEKAPSPKREARFRGVLGWVIYFFVMIFIVFALPKVLSTTLGTPYPMAAITSGSMWPAFREGDLVFIKHVEPAELQVGDVVVFRNVTNGTFTIHRIVRLDSETFTTKGDANFDPDAPVKYADLIGRTVLISGKPLRVPYAGAVTVFASNLKQSPQ